MALVPGLPYRQEPRTHPYTRHGRQVDVLQGGRWVEVWECGLAHPGALSAARLAGRGGLALGMGLDRMLMLINGIPDIRLLRSADPRIADQMRDLAANSLRDRIYLAIHQGTEYQWAHQGAPPGAA